MNVKATFLRIRRALHERQAFEGQPVPHGVAGLVRLEDGTVEYQMRVETAPGVWRVDYRRPVVPKRPVNGELLFGHERRGRVLQQQMDQALEQAANVLIDRVGQDVRGRTERMVMLDDANFRLQR